MVLQNSINQNTVNTTITTQSATPFVTSMGSGTPQGTVAGISITAVDYRALAATTTGSQNTAVGYNAINAVTTGSGNCALGFSAGSSYTGSETNNICIGNNVTGSTGESNVSRIGGTATSITYINSTSTSIGSSTAAPNQTLSVFGSIAYGYGSTATSYSAVSTDAIIGVASTAAPRTITLPAAASTQQGRVLTVKDQSGGAGTNQITINTAGGSIDGTVSVSIALNYGAKSFYCDSSNWFTI